MVAETATALQPALDELIRQAAQGEVIHNDDTTMTVLSLAPEARARAEDADVTPGLPAECRHILHTLRTVYRCDEDARAAGLAPADRLAAHQARSGPLLAELHPWLADQIDAHRIEPNSGLGQAIDHFLKHWTPLTLLLRVPGAPLDNNG